MKKYSLFAAKVVSPSQIRRYLIVNFMKHIVRKKTFKTVKNYLYEHLLNRKVHFA